MTKKNKQTILNQGQQLLIQGRHYCDCQAQIHSLINNCMVCGKIVCTQESEGPCMFCGNLVLGKGKTEKDFPEMPQFQNINQFQLEEMQKAIDHKDRLIQAQKKDAAKNIYDEQTDWYQIEQDIWQSQQNRDEARKNLITEKQEQQENAKKIFIQFDVQQGFIEDKPIEKNTKLIAQQFLQEKEAQEKKTDQKENSENQILMDQKLLVGNEDQIKLFDQIHKNIQQTYKDQLQNNKNYNTQGGMPSIEKYSCKIKHDYDEYQQIFQEALENKQSNNQEQFDIDIFDLEAQDKGKCLSLLQPWASLVIHGIMRFESRHWETSYRGPLWIQAGSTAPEQQLIDKIENQYREFYKDIQLEFPSKYPTGCLLGLVDLQAILTRQEYQQQIQTKFREKNEAEYVFVIRNPRKLYLPIKMPGHQKIFNLDTEIIKIAQKQLKKVNIGFWPYQNIQISQIQQNQQTIINEIAQFGQIIEQNFKISEMNDLIQFIDKKMRESNTKSNGPNNTLQIELNYHFPCMEKILKMIEYPQILEQLSPNIETYFIQRKQKVFNLDNQVLGLINIGVNVEIQVETADSKIKQVILQSGDFILVGNEKKLRFLGFKDDGFKDDLQLNGNQKALFIQLIKKF